MRLRFLGMICLLVCWVGTSCGQQTDDCFKTGQLYQLYLSNVNSASAIMEYEKWLPVLENKNDMFVAGEDTVPFSSKLWKYTLSFDDLFFKFYWNDSLFSNMLEIQLSEACYESILKRVEKETALEQATADSSKMVFKKNTLCTIEFWKTAAAAPTYHLRYYNPSEISHEMARLKARKAEELELQRRRLLAVESALRRADSLRLLEQYETAVAGLNQVLGTVPSYDGTVRRKIEVLQVDIRNKKVKSLLSEGEQLLTARRYNDSRRRYEEVIKMEPANETALTAMAKIDRIKSVLQARKINVYDYKLLNPESYSTLLQQLQTGLNQHVDHFAGGRLRFKMNIAFDTLGINRSTYIYYPESDSLPNFMDGLLLSSFLQPTTMEGIAVSSLTSGDYSLWWNTFNVIAKKKKDGQVVITEGSVMPATGEFIDQQLEQKEFPTGRYFFQVKEKRLNDALCSKVSLYKYKTVGPEAMLYSMLYPGVGTLAATRGTKGWTALTSFTLLVGGGIVSNFFYQQQYDKYLTATIGSDKDRYRKRSKQLKWCSAICFGATAVVYIGDAITALTYGFKNRKASKEMRAKLKTHDLQLRDEKLIIK